jgi:hypothetical protein
MPEPSLSKVGAPHGRHGIGKSKHSGGGTSIPFENIILTI